jgi:hypothetical protein
MPGRVTAVLCPRRLATIATGMMSMSSFSYAVPNARRTEIVRRFHQQVPHVHIKRLLLLLPARPCRVSETSILDREPATRRGSGRDATAAQIDLFGTARLGLRRAERGARMAAMRVLSFRLSATLCNVRLAGLL